MYVKQVQTNHKNKLYTLQVFIPKTERINDVK